MIIKIRIQIHNPHTMRENQNKNKQQGCGPASGYDFSGISKNHNPDPDAQNNKIRTPQSGFAKKCFDLQNIICEEHFRFTYLIPRSMCSWIPKPKFPLSEKFSFLSSYSRTLKPRSRISSALGPLQSRFTVLKNHIIASVNQGWKTPLRPVERIRISR